MGQQYPSSMIWEIFLVIIHISVARCKEALLDFMLYGCRLRFHFPSISLIFTPNTGLYTPISPCYFPNGHIYFSNTLQSSPVGFYPCEASCTIVAVGDAKLEVWVDLNGWVRVGVRDEIFARNVYCAKPNTNTDAHYGSRSRKGFGAQATRSTLEYDLMTAITIRPLTHPVTC